MSQVKTIKLYGKNGPNPPKVEILLNLLNLPYEIEAVPLSDVKKPEYVAINPNGRVPAIFDPNSNLTLWESGAIVEYLIEKYDKDNVLSFPAGSNEAYLTKQWLYYQVTGQGPYYGQVVWFQKYHHEPLPSAISRYVGEVNRVTAVLEGQLERQKVEYSTSEPWLVGNKMTFVDLSFIPWQAAMMGFLNKESGFAAEDYPNVKLWIDRMTTLPKVKAVMSSMFGSSSHASLRNSVASQ